MTSNIVLKCSGSVNKNAVAAILARAITSGNAKEYLREVSEKTAGKVGSVGALYSETDGQNPSATKEVVV